MPLHETGYLGKEIGTWIQKHRKENNDWFVLAEDVNRFAHKAMYDLEITDNDARHLVVSSAYLRSLSQLQGTVIMSERGMIYEAATLTRGLMETVFVLSAATNDRHFALQYIDSAELKKAGHVLKMFQAGPGIVKLLEATITKDEINKKRSHLKAKGVREFTIAEIAEKADLVDYYRCNYSFFSLTAAHPTPNSLDQYAEATPSGDLVSLLWGPDVKGLDRILSVAIESCLIAIAKVAEVFGQPWKKQIESFRSRFQFLAETLTDFSFCHIRTQPEHEPEKS